MIEPIVVMDTREQQPLDITAYPVESDTLPVGDYGVKGFSDWENPRFIVERKSLDDLIGSLTIGRERFMREIEKMRQFRFAALLVEADRRQVIGHEYVSAAKPKAMLASLDALQVRAGVHVIWAGDHDFAARRLEGLVRQFVRGIEKDTQRLKRAAKVNS